MPATRGAFGNGAFGAYPFGGSLSEFISFSETLNTTESLTKQAIHLLSESYSLAEGFSKTPIPTFEESITITDSGIVRSLTVVFSATLSLIDTLIHLGADIWEPELALYGTTSWTNDTTTTTSWTNDTTTTTSWTDETLPDLTEDETL